MVFTDLTPTRMEQELALLETPASDDLIRQWMDEQKLRLRKIRKVLPGGISPDRDAQFRKIAELIDKYEYAGNPYFSVDTKAKEFLGQLFRKGRIRCSRAFDAFDHDFPTWADGVIFPHGIFDPVRNRGHINLGLSHDTTQFACDSLQWYWNRIGQFCYPNAKSILLLFDCGGSNAANKYIFKHDLQAVVDSIGIEIRVAHYPSYCSKYNPIERRLFRKRLTEPFLARGLPEQAPATQIRLDARPVDRQGACAFAGGGVMSGRAESGGESPPKPTPICRLVHVDTSRPCCSAAPAEPGTLRVR